MTSDTSPELCTVFAQAFERGQPHVADGQALRILTAHFAAGETSDDLKELGAQTGEEMGAVVSGLFRIDAADESYELQAGEAIIIPAGENRLWTCLSAGALYRVISRGRPA